ncbi:uncharacterized protein [Scyliorhinus torazame]|uniref:Myb/SANT-like DNA-binding domain-containing protein n=1 Tax=Scyliorhinus torazame TaxID=75743 RepID=A0A401PRA8_SCYTO|nr:hypothetical protein [Scyliorhinus torazame]
MASENLAAKKRTQNFTHGDLNTLLHEVEKRKIQILGRGKTKAPRKIQSVAWKQVAEKLSASSEIPRTPEQCRKKLCDLMRSARAKHAHNAREHSTGDGFPYLKDLTPQEDHAWLLLGLIKPLETSDGDLGMSQADMVTAEQNVGETRAAAEIPERDLMEVSTSQQCSAEAAAEEGEALQQAEISDTDSDVQGDSGLEKGEASDDLTAVLEDENSEPSGGEEPSTSVAPPEHSFENRTDVTDDLRIQQICDVVTAVAGGFEASARTQEESLNKVSQQLQRVAEVNAEHMQISQQVHELVRQQNELLRQQNHISLQQKDVSLQKNELLRQQNEYLLQILNKVVTPSSLEPPRSESVAAGKDTVPSRSGIQEVKSRGRGRARGRRARN